MLEYRRVGELMGTGSRSQLSLPESRPLSYLRVKHSSGENSVGLTRALLEHRGTEFRMRIPLLAESVGGREKIAEALERFETVLLVFRAIRGIR